MFNALHFIKNENYEEKFYISMHEIRKLWRSHRIAVKELEIINYKSEQCSHAMF